MTRHCTMSVALIATLLNACSGSSVPNARTIASNAGSGPLIRSKTFHFTARKQRFVVPFGVTKLTVVVRGAAGGGEVGPHGHEYFGRGGRVYAVIPVQSGEKLYVFVGGQGHFLGGFNGGEAGGNGTYTTYGGGGASDVRTGGAALRDRILVAGGGGGEGAPYRTGFGGEGGGSAGGAGGGGGARANGSGGAGGTQQQGGSGGAGGQGQGESNENGQPGTPGTLGLGGAGGAGGFSYSAYGGGGGGGAGGGYYGGGGGGGGGAANVSYAIGGGGGGGGGSSYIESGALKFQTWQGWKNATTDGLVVFSWQ